MAAGLAPRTTASGYTPPPAPAPAKPVAPSWMAEPTSAFQAMRDTVGEGRGPASMSVSDDMLTSRQLTQLLSTDNPYITRARTSAAEYSGARGLQNSSIGAGAGEAAAIDAGFDIANADAGRYFEAGRFNTEQANQFSRDANAFDRTGALTALQGGMDINRDQLGYSFKAGESALDRSLEKELLDTREQNEDDRLRASLSVNADLQREELDWKARQSEEERRVDTWVSEQDRTSRDTNAQRELAARTSELGQRREDDLSGGYRDANTAAMNAYNNTITAIQASEMDPDVKTAQIAQAQATFQQQTQWLSTMYANAPGWQQEWATFTIEP